MNKSWALGFTLAASIGLSAPTQASDYNIQCNTNFLGEMSFSNNVLSLTNERNEEFIFGPQGTLTRDGQQVSLTSEQRELARRYYSDIETAIPLVVDITVEALEIVSYSLGEVFTGLLGEDSKLPKLIDDKIDNVTTAINEHVYQDPQSITFNSVYFENDLGFDENLDKEIDALTEEIMATAMGEIFMALGKAMISGGSAESFETRMEKLGEEIEMKAEAMALTLESKSQDLCDTIERLDNTEEQLQQIDGLENLDLVTVTYNKA